MLDGARVDDGKAFGEHRAMGGEAGAGGGAADYRMQEDDKIQTLMRMTPNTLRLRVPEEQGKGSDLAYDELREELQFRVVDILDNGGAKRVSALVWPEANPQGEAGGGGDGATRTASRSIDGVGRPRSTQSRILNPEASPLMVMMTCL